jgi:hypothetical protein
VQILRRRLPSGLVGAIFPQTIVVDDRVKRSLVRVIVAIANERCGGCFAVVTRDDLKRVLAMVAVVAMVA